MLVKEVGEQDTQGDSNKDCNESCDIKNEVELNEELGSTSEGDDDAKSRFSCIM